MGTLLKVTIPRAPQIQNPSHMTGVEQVMSDTQDACYSHVAHVPTWRDLALPYP